MTEITFKSDMGVELIDSMGSDETVARAARVSTGRDQLEQGKIEGLIGYLMREGHCYDSETEVLTLARGWVKFPDVTLEDKVLSRTVTGEINWETPSEVIDQDYAGEMVRMTGRNLDLLVTPGHRMLAEHRTRAGWQEAGIHLASDFSDRAYRVLRGGGVKGAGVDVPERVAKLLGFIIADGHVGRSNISFHLKKDRKVNWLVNMGGGYVAKNANNTYHLSTKFSVELTRLARLTYNDLSERVIPGEVIESWSGQSIKWLLEGFLEGDGHYAADGRVTATTVSPALAEQLQVVAALSGGAAAVRGPFDYGEASVSSGFAKTYKPLYSVTFASDRHLKVRVGWTLRERNRQVQKVDYRGTIHCVTVPSGVIYVRRNGHTLWSGNSSTFEHCSLTIRVHVPISTHRQAMTHRTLSKNSESGRYKELEPTFYLPDGDRPLANAGSGAHPDLVKLEFDFGEFVRRREAHYNACWEQYQWELSQGVATEVARDVLPLATYTSAYMTGNLLAWFNFLRLRAGYTGHPQHEIQEVAKKVEAIIEELYPITYKAWKESC